MMTDREQFDAIADALGVLTPVFNDDIDGAARFIVNALAVKSDESGRILTDRAFVPTASDPQAVPPVPASIPCAEPPQSEMIERATARSNHREDVEGLVNLLRALASDCDDTDGWEDAAPTVRSGADTIEALLAKIAGLEGEVALKNKLFDELRRWCDDAERITASKVYAAFVGNLKRRLDGVAALSPKDSQEMVR